MSQTPKTRIEAKLHNSFVIQQPMVRTFATGGGHGPADTLVEGDDRIVTKKWQGYPPENLNVLGKPIPPLRDVAMPRMLGTAQYTTRVWFPDLLHAKVLVSPHPRARVRRLDVARAAEMPGVAYILTHQNAPSTHPIAENLNFQGQVVAIVAAESEDLGEDAIAAIEVEYDVLPFATTLEQVMSPDAPVLQQGRRNLAQLDPDHPLYHPEATFRTEFGDVEQGFRDADEVREFTYTYAGGVVLPMQPCSCVAKWDGDRLTFWAMGQGIYPERATLAAGLGIDPEQIRFIDKWNGGTFGAAQRAQVFYPWIAHMAKMAGRPVRLMLPKDQELAHLQVKPENIVKFKVGARRDGRITACERTFYQAYGDGFSASTTAGGRSELYVHVIPNWRETGYNYTTNSPRQGASRSNMQQEFKWSWEQMMDEMAAAVGMDPARFRLMNVQKPGTRVSREQGGPTITPMPETEDGVLTYDSYASVEVVEEGIKAIGWDRRNAVPGGNAGRFKHGFGMAMSQHHAGRVGYREGEVGFERRVKEIEASGDSGAGGGGGDNGIFQADLELDESGTITLRNAMPDSGTNHDTAIAMLVSEILGFTSLDHVVVIWGDSDLAPSSVKWNSGLTTQLQGGACNSGADRLRQDLLRRASATLGVDAAQLQIRDGVISSTVNPDARTTFAQMARANGGMIRQRGRCVHPGSIGRALNRGIGACFAEVEVDTWTGNWRFIRAAYCHDAGFVINPLLGEADMAGSLTQATQLTTEAMPWDREFPGTRHYSVGYLSYRLPTIMDIPEVTNVFVNSLEPRWFFGAKGFAETAIGAPPGAIANAIYNACGVRLRDHPITREKIMAGLKANGVRA